MCSSSAMVQLALFYSVTMQVLPLIERMINPVVAVTASRLPKRGVACCIHGLEWRTCREGFNFRCGGLGCVKTRRRANPGESSDASSERVKSILSCGAAASENQIPRRL